MQQFTKKRLAKAIGVMLGGAAVAAVPMASQAVNPGFAPTGTGQVLIFPYYTVNDGWMTLFNVTNVSTSALAVKVRFHEAGNSRDVLDFNVLMSPQDVWSVYLEMNENGGATLKRAANDPDLTCTSPQFPENGFDLNPVAYTGEFSDGGDDSLSRLTEGYVELIVMGECPADRTGTGQCFSGAANTAPSTWGIGYLTKHDNGVPRNCTEADRMFLSTTGTWDGSSFPGHGAPLARGALNYSTRGYGSVRHPAPLKGNVGYINTATGIGAGTDALHLSRVVPLGADGTGFSMVTAQEYPYFLEPTIATAPSGRVWDASRLVELEDRFNWAGVLNEWSSNQANGVETDWVINFPTKAYHVDQFCNSVQANNNRWRFNGVNVLTCATADPRMYALTNAQCGPYAGTRTDGDYRSSGGVQCQPLIEPFQSVWNNGSNVTVALTVYDREEGSAAAGGTVPSPAPPQARSQLRWETNVITIGSGAEASALGSPRPVVLDGSGLLASGKPYGWLDLRFPSARWNNANEGMPAPRPGMAANETAASLPVYGFVMSSRNFGATDRNYGMMMNHGYRDPNNPVQ